MHGRNSLQICEFLGTVLEKRLDRKFTFINGKSEFSLALVCSVSLGYLTVQLQSVQIERAVYSSPSGSFRVSALGQVLSFLG